MITFIRIDNRDIPWDSIQAIGEMNVFQTKPWLDFLIENNGAELVIASINEDDTLIGYYTGLIVRKFGLKILGSPFRGWSTYFMGFNLVSSAAYHDILRAFPSFAFSELKCHYCEIIDPNINRNDFVGLGYRIEPLPWFAIDLIPGEDEIYTKMKSSGRQAIRKSIKNNIEIVEANESDFAEDYYSQYTDVMQKRSLVPTYDADTVRKIIEGFQDTGNILLLRARDSEKRSIATALFLAYNKLGIYWGGASWRKYQSLRPNEPLFWYAMKKLKQRGIQNLHMGAECGKFKEKLGSYHVDIYRIMIAKNILLAILINIVLSPKSMWFKNWALRKL